MFNPNDTVEFTDRKGDTLRGVVLKCNNDRRRPRCTVQTDRGTYTVPEPMLRKAKVGAKHAESLAAVGGKFLETKDARRRERKEQRQEEARRYNADRPAWHRGDLCEVRTDEFGFGGSWKQALIVEVRPDGRITVTNPKRALVDKVAALGADVPEHLQHTHAHITVDPRNVRRPR